MDLQLKRLVLLYVVLFSIQITKSDVNKDLDKLKTVKLPPCQACKNFVVSFKKGMERTARGKFEGGDTAWEEERLGSYATSEVRLIEIQEKLCSDVERGEDQCHQLAEEWEHHLEEWWFNKQKDDVDLQTWLCIDIVAHCCPENHYGPDCEPCVGYPNNVCNNNGKCKGAGTRKGNGQCACDAGYEGSFCDKCAVNHYESYKDETKLLCSPCHAACLNACSQAGPKGCVACKPGWSMHTEKGCLDINECVADHACQKNQFCVNNEGSYMCLECDKSCDGCDGDGPDMCKKCAAGYVFKDNMCVDKWESERDSHVTMTRYLTYFGLCVATCIVFQKNTMIASIIGVCVALYISISEFMLQANIVNNSELPVAF